MDHKQFDECCCSFCIGLSGLPDFPLIKGLVKLCWVELARREESTWETAKFISREYGTRFSAVPKYSLVTAYKESAAPDGDV